MPTAEIDPLARWRHRVLLAACPLGAGACAAAAWVAGPGNPVKIASLGVFATTLTLFTLALWRKPSALLVIERGVFALTFGYLWVELARLLWLAPEGVPPDAEMLLVVPWEPLVFVLAYVVLERRAAIVGSVVFASGCILITAIAWLLSPALRASALGGAMLQQVLFSNPLYILLLFVVGALKEARVNAEGRALVAEDLASTDALTGLLNRRGMIQTLASRAPAQGRSLLLLDIDHFKAVNDTHGHAAGDAIIAQVASVLRAETRGHDASARWGGEEFLVALDDAPLVAALARAERIREAIAATTEPAVTTSIGVAFALNGESLDDAVSRADEALYRAKDAGRNRVMSEDGPDDATDTASPLPDAGRSRDQRLDDVP